MTELGFTALSVETITNFSTPCSCARSATFFVPKTLFFTASAGFHSIIGTCLWAAAWKTTLGRSVSKIPAMRRESQMSAMQGTMVSPG